MKDWHLWPTTTYWVWLVWDSEAICATSWTPWNARAIPFLHTHITCSLLLLSGVSVVVVTCPWKMLPWHCVSMNWCYFLLLIIFKMAVEIFLKEQASKSLKSKHLVAIWMLGCTMPLACTFWNIWRVAWHFIFTFYCALTYRNKLTGEVARKVPPKYWEKLGGFPCSICSLYCRVKAPAAAESGIVQLVAADTFLLPFLWMQDLKRRSRMSMNTQFNKTLACLLMRELEWTKMFSAPAVEELTSCSLHRQCVITSPDLHGPRQDADCK